MSHEGGSMATDLRDRLRDLADHTPSGSPPADLWTRGVRRRRATQVGTSVLVAALALILGVGGWAWHSSRQDLEPVAPYGTPHLPDRFFLPSPWLHGFDGAPGPLVAVMSAPRKTIFHTTQGVVGVTASTGEYGFVDLPGVASSLLESSSVAISPDGLHVAYWLANDPSRSPNGAGVGGVGIYDTVTGKARTYRVASPHGLYPSVLMWSDDRTLVFDYGQWQHGGHGGGGADGFAPFVWGHGFAQPRPVDDSRIAPGFDERVTAGFGRAVVPGSGSAGVWIVDPRHLSTERWVPGVRTSWPVHLSPSGTTLAHLRGGGTPYQIVTRAATPVGATHISEPRSRVFAGGHRTYDLVGWQDDSHLVVVTRAPGENLELQLERLDITTGQQTTLVAPPVIPDIATDLLVAPSRHASPPPSPWSQRVELGLVLGSLLGLGLLLLAVRRARRA